MYVEGQANVICDRCGFKYKSAQLKLEWTGHRVCSDCFETKHPQLAVKGKADKQMPAWVRPGASTETITNDWDDF